MSWVRSHIKLGARLALLALAIQFGLAFGHAHARVIHSTSVVSAVASSDIGRFVPDHAHPGDNCAICATISLAQSLLDASSPALPALETTTTIVLVRAADTPPLIAPRASYHSRGPPVS